MANQGGYWSNNQGGNDQNGGWGNNQGPTILCGQGSKILIGPTEGGSTQCGSNNTQGVIQGGGWGNQTQGGNNQGRGYGYSRK
ncbi:hypothetical protein JCGZ_16824 [Jatropha curcas]|uniref:Uncharacterized protein n=1 Tax=Jatropha curcas TaxID=180498 RepID=A0A067L534_JATCU|nr:hypothetical protein JCGZ_16824 [Jatropha curcas]